MLDPYRGLNDLLARYAEACPTPEPSADFMPGLWRKIEARRGILGQFRFYSWRMAATAAAFGLLVVAQHFSPRASAREVYTMTYMDTLEADSAPEILAYAAPVPALEGAQEESR
jgi:hypothetical protein